MQEPWDWLSSPPSTNVSAFGPAGIACPLTNLGVIRARGADAQSFLQSQLSNDIAGLPADSSRLAAYCNPKGRMIALLRVFRWGDDFGLLLPRELLDKTLARLRMFVLRSKVELIVEPAGVIGVHGPAAIAALNPLLDGELPAAEDGIAVREDCVVLRPAGSQPRLQLIAHAAPLRRYWSQLADTAEPVAPAVWDLLDIRAGLPTVLANTQEAFVPQMANLDLVGGISFTKGCYPGQEIVARMHYLGNLKRRTYRAAVEGEAPAPGAEIRTQEGALAGQVMLSAPRVEGGAELLAVLQIERASQGGLICEGRELSLLPLPYSLAAD